MGSLETFTLTGKDFSGIYGTIWVSLLSGIDSVAGPCVTVLTSISGFGIATDFTTSCRVLFFFNCLFFLLFTQHLYIARKAPMAIMRTTASSIHSHTVNPDW